MRNRALKYSIGFAIAGLIISSLITYVERNTVNTFEEYIPYLTLGDNVKNRSTQAHLWFEELMAGDESLNFENDILARFKGAREILQSAYDGKETTLGTFSNTVDEDTKVLLKEGIIALEKLEEAADERWRMKLQTDAARQAAVSDSTQAASVNTTGEEAGGALDQKFDTSYDQFQSTIDRFIQHINTNVKTDTAYFSGLSWVSIVLLIAVFGILCTILYRLQRGNEIMEAENKKRLTDQVTAVASLTHFIEAISAGDYSVDININSDGDNTLNTTLLSMRDKLRSNAEEDRRRNWATSGLAQIGELLRASGTTTTDLLDNIIRFAVKYTRSNQGGLFLVNDDNESDRFLELVACYAFERKKFLTKKVGLGEGLVGQCFLEGERIYLLEVPAEYVTITSGLGGSTPNALLIVPLKVNEKIYGVLELATFGRYQDFEIELVEKLAESIASTISAVRVNESTRILLEKTQQQAEEMRSQEEEMRQNMEELEATQEEMRRKEKHIQSMLDGEKKRNEISQKNRKVLMDLTKVHDIQSGNWNPALEKITSVIANQLNVSRCSIWTINEHRNKITSDKLFQQSTRAYESGTELFAKDFPGYFEAVTAEEIIVAKDAITHSATREFAEVYLKPLSIYSMLDVPFFNEGRIAGVICCEHQHEQKDWTEEDVEFLKSCADLVTVCFNTMKINTMLDNLNDAQETMQTIIDNIPRAVFWKDKELKFQGCNKIFASVAGLKSPKELIGHTDFDMPWKEHAEAYRADDQAVMKSRKARLDLEERNVNSSGQESWVLTSKVPVTNQHGEVVAVLGMFEDITERKHKEADMEAKLKELDELRKLVGSRK